MLRYEIKYECYNTKIITGLKILIINIKFINEIKLIK